MSLFCPFLCPFLFPDAPLELPSFQLTPSQPQVVFQGDSLPFQCQASFVAEDMQVLWYQNGRMVKSDAAQGIVIEKRMVQNCSLIARYESLLKDLSFITSEHLFGINKASVWSFVVTLKLAVSLISPFLFPISALTISNIQPGFTGNWECRVRTSRGNNTRTVHIVVLESSAEYCAPERVSNNKGEFK